MTPCSSSPPLPPQGSCLPHEGRRIRWTMAAKKTTLIRSNVDRHTDNKPLTVGVHVQMCTPTAVNMESHFLNLFYFVG